ncbi:MAG: HAD family hydrolase [Paracoccus sp. (in: a-proteobacteria)]|nr:HAD family hydrolase [Paracoccus sp. (in: a-proteobacteria)]
MPGDFDAIIFDFDGTLIASEALALEAAGAALRELGHAVPDGFLNRLVGVDDNRSHTLIEAHFGPIERTSFDTRIRALIDARIAEHGLPLRPYAVEVLDLLDAQPAPLPRAIATSSYRARAEYKLRLTALAPRFAALVARDCVTDPKPAPEPFLLAASRLGVDPARCLAFEDSETGAEAAHRAGMFVVQIPDLGPATGRFADLVAPDLLSGARAAGVL